MNTSLSLVTSQGECKKKQQIIHYFDAVPVANIVYSSEVTDWLAVYAVSPFPGKYRPGLPEQVLIP